MRAHARSAAWLALAAVAFAAHYALTLRLAPGLRLELGSVGCPRPGFLAFLASWWTLGCAAAAALAAAFAAWPARAARAVAAPESDAVSRAAQAGWAALAAALAALVELTVLGGASVTDDEASYRFASELLAGGRLAVPSPAAKEFFDHFLLLNDGRLRSVYFLGWPALRAVGVWMGAGAWVNVALFALTAPAVARLGRLWLGARWGAAATALVVTSPFLLVLAATDLSHTAAIFCLAWAAWFGRRQARGARDAALFGLALAAMFWVRPVAAIGYGAPLVAIWLRERLRAPARWRALGAFLLPAALLAPLFLATQAAQFGSPWSTGYHRLRDYHLANDARFVPVSEAALRRPVPEFDFASLPRAIERTGCGLLRAGADFFGWPMGLLPLVAAVGVAGSAPAWAMFGGGLASLLFQRSPGIDTFGPVHYAELALPAAFLLAAAGRAMAARLARRRDAARATRVATAALAALAVAAWLGYVPARWASLRAMAASARAPEALALREAKAPAVVFAPFPWVPPPCMPQPSRYFRWLRPISSPELADPIVWANHFDVERDRALLERFPGRRGYVLFWEPTCELRLVALDSAAAGAVPPGLTRLGP